MCSLPVAVIWGGAAVTPSPSFFVTVHAAVEFSRHLSLVTVAGAIFVGFGVKLIALNLFFLKARSLRGWRISSSGSIES